MFYRFQRRRTNKKTKTQSVNISQNGIKQLMFVSLLLFFFFRLIFKIKNEFHILSRCSCCVVQSKIERIESDPCMNDAILIPSKINRENINAYKRSVFFVAKKKICLYIQFASYAIYTSHLGLTRVCALLLPCFYVHRYSLFPFNILDINR